MPFIIKRKSTGRYAVIGGGCVVDVIHVDNGRGLKSGWLASARWTQATNLCGTKRAAVEAAKTMIIKAR